MDRNSAPSPRPAPCPRRAGPRLGRTGMLVGLGLLALGGCAAQGPSMLNAAALAQQAYASNATIHSVSNALDQRLDLMLSVRTAEAMQ